MKYLITGGCGFLGVNLAREALQKKHELIILDNLYHIGSYQNLEWLKKKGEFRFIHIDIRDYNGVERVIKRIKPSVIFHLAGQVAMTTSLENPRLDFEINALGTFNILEAVRLYSPQTIILYSSTNKVYGDLEWVKYKETETRYITTDYPHGFDENIPLDFHSPYGCSKGAAEQYILDYARMFDLRTVVFRHSSMYGGRQFPTYEQGWIGWFCRKAIETKKGILKEPFIISGTGKQVRDILYISDAVKLYFVTVDNIELLKGKAFNIGGGMENSLSLIELFKILEREFDVKLKYSKIPWRASDQKIFIANTQKIRKLINWEPEINKLKGIRMMLDWLRNSCK